MHKFKLFDSLTESKLFRTKETMVRNFAERDICEALYIILITLHIMDSDEQTKAWCRSYIRRTFSFGNFNSWHVSSNDLYICLHVLDPSASDDVRIGSGISDYNSIIQWLRGIITDRHNPTLVRKIFTRLDYNLKVKDPSLQSIRRMVARWNELDNDDRRLVCTRLIQIMRSRYSSCEVRPFFERYIERNGYELTGVCNIETGEGCDDQEPNTASKKSKLGFLGAIAGLGAGVIAGNKIYKK